MANKMLETSNIAVASETLTRATLPAIHSERKRKRKRNSLGPALTPTSARNASQCNAPQEKKLGKKKKKGIKSASVPRSSASTSSSQKKSEGKITRKDRNMNRCVFGKGGLPVGTKVGYFIEGKKLLDGITRGLGIFCSCCEKVVSASKFEAHAGWASRKKPYSNIFTSNGVSLREYAISLGQQRKCATKDHDDLCTFCSIGGNLLLCDGCPRAFHKECRHLQSVPRGKCYCKNCENMLQREKSAERNVNAIAAGRVPGVDPIEEIRKLCMRIVKNPENVAIACCLCRKFEYSKDVFGLTTSIICDQCENEYHVGCLKKEKMANLKRLPKGKWYCSNDCKKMCCDLKNLVKCEPQILPDNLMDLISKKQIDGGLDGITDSDVRWRLLNCQISSRQAKLLSEAVAIFNECFDPIIDVESGRDFISAMAYCEDIQDQYFGGMYTAVLTVNSVVVSAGIFRIFGKDLAELPLVATSKSNQGKGYFHVLFSCIEKLLISFNVKKIILPSAAEAEAFWINKFGFTKSSPKQLADSRKKHWKMFTFEGASMLTKKLPASRAGNSDDTSPGLSGGDP